MDKKNAEAIRYLGYKKKDIDLQIIRLVENGFEQLKSYEEPRLVFKQFPLNTDDNGRIAFGSLLIESENLQKNLKGCESVIVLGATLGIKVDRYMKIQGIKDMANAVVIQACAAASLEEYCNNWEEELRRKYKKEEWFLRPRFSPGYGDFSIKHQKDLLQLIDGQRKIGLTTTENYMLNPTKSITAIIGVSREDQHCVIQGCESCCKKDCEYKRS